MSAAVDEVEQRVHVAVVLPRVVQRLHRRDQRVHARVDQLVRRVVALWNVFLTLGSQSKQTSLQQVPFPH